MLGRSSRGGQVLVIGLNPGTAMDVEAGMMPRHDELDHFLCDRPFPQKQEIAEGLDRNDCPWSSLLFWREAKEKHLL